MDSKVCCMFSDPVPGHAVDNRDLEHLAADEWRRDEKHIFRCRKCGNYVLYTYKENIFYTGWDNAAIDEDYYPIEEPTIIDGKFPADYHVIKNAPTLHAQYYEVDYGKRSWSRG